MQPTQLPLGSALGKLDQTSFSFEHFVHQMQDTHSYPTDVQNYFVRVKSTYLLVCACVYV